MLTKTTSWTDEQQVEVDKIVSQLVMAASCKINSVAPSVQKMDKRPKQVWSADQPDVFFPYVNQAILEDLIAELQELV